MAQFGQADLRLQLACELDEERLERELRREVELLELPPRLAHRLGRALGAEQALARRVGAQLVEPVDVDRRRARRRRRRRRGRGTRRRAPRAARAAPRARRRAGRAARAARPRAAAARGPATFTSSSSFASAPRSRAHSSSAARRVGRLEAGLAVDGARLLEQRLAPRGGAAGRAAARAGRAGRRRRARARRAAPRRARARARRRPRASRARDSRRNGTSWQRERIVSGIGPRSSATSTITAYGGGSSRSFSSASAASSFSRCALRIR